MRCCFEVEGNALPVILQRHQGALEVLIADFDFVVTGCFKPEFLKHPHTDGTGFGTKHGDAVGTGVCENMLEQGRGDTFSGADGPDVERGNVTAGFLAAKTEGTAVIDGDIGCRLKDEAVETCRGRGIGPGLDLFRRIMFAALGFDGAVIEIDEGYDIGFFGVADFHGRRSELAFRNFKHLFIGPLDQHHTIGIAVTRDIAGRTNDFTAHAFEAVVQGIEIVRIVGEQ